MERKRICKHTQKGGVAYPYYQLFKRLRDQNSLFYSARKLGRSSLTKFMM